MNFETISWLDESKRKDADVSIRKASQSVDWSAAAVECNTQEVWPEPSDKKRLLYFQRFSRGWVRVGASIEFSPSD